jgi:hypothetical protein
VGVRINNTHSYTHNIFHLFVSLYYTFFCCSLGSIHQPLLPRKGKNFSLENVKLDFTVIIIANERLDIMDGSWQCAYMATAAKENEELEVKEHVFSSNGCRSGKRAICMFRRGKVLKQVDLAVA